MNVRHVFRPFANAAPVFPVKWLWLVVFVIAVAAAASGCATHKIDWNARVGSYSFDQAVMELGPPDKSATLTDGTRVAEWLAQRGARGGVQVGFGAGYYHPWHGMGWYLSEPASPDRMLRLTFGPDSKLREWKRVYR